MWLQTALVGSFLDAICEMKNGVKLGLQYDAGNARDASEDADEDASDNTQAGVIL